MFRPTQIMLLAVIAQAFTESLAAKHATNAQDSVNMMVHKLVDRVFDWEFKAWPLYCTDLENTSLGKGFSQVALSCAPSGASSPFFVPYFPGAPSHPKSTTMSFRRLLLTSRGILCVRSSISKRDSPQRNYHKMEHNQEMRLGNGDQELVRERPATVNAEEEADADLEAKIKAAKDQRRRSAVEQAYGRRRVSGSGFQAMQLCEVMAPLSSDVLSTLTAALGAPRVRMLAAALVRPPAVTHVRVNTLRVSRPEAVACLDHGISPWREQLAREGRIGPEWREHDVLPDVLVLPHVPPAPATLACFPRLLGHPPAVVVSAGCGVAVMRGADVYAGGVVSAAPGLHGTGEAVSVWALLHGTVNRGEALEHLASTMDVKVALLGFGEARMSRAKMLSPNQKGAAVVVTRRVVADAPPLNGVCDGLVRVQNLPSALVAHALMPKAGDLVLDLCAAPGGKATHVATLMKGQGLLLAVDRTRRKAERLAKTVEAAGLDTIIRVVAMDSTAAVAPREQASSPAVSHEQRHAAILSALEGTDLKGVHRAPVGLPSEAFDAVLLDPPCSGLGQRPLLVLDIPNGMKTEDYAPLQRGLFWSAVMLARAGGVISYSTCTLLPQENEEMVRYVLDTYPCLRLVSAKPRLGGPGLPGYGLSEDERNMVQRFDPSDEQQPDSIGFFLAVFEKVESVFKDGMARASHGHKQTDM